MMSLGHDLEKKARTQDIRILQNVTFESMLLAQNTLDGLNSSGFFRPSPIQLHGIPLGKCGFDLLLEAKSGTGKTAVFTIIALEQLDLDKGLQTVILAPTREIAAQICDVIKQIGSNYKGLKVEVVMGGLPVQEDVKKFKEKNVHIVVGSPGRLRHLIHDKVIDTSTVRLVVLDEADKLVEKGFLVDINYIFSNIPDQRQVVMSSATYPDDAKLLIEKIVVNAQHVCPDSNSVLVGVEQKIINVSYNSNVVKQTQFRYKELVKILSKKPFKQCLVFCNYQTRVIELHRMLNKDKWPAEQLYGQQEQSDRLDALKTLQEYKCRILISTDLAARGIDASNVDLVINFEPPLEWQTYLHRIGRAGRFGSYGTAVTMVSEGKEAKSFKQILTTINVPLVPFWDDNKVPCNDDPKIKFENDIVNGSRECLVTNTEPQLQIKEDYNKLWDLLTSPDNFSQTEEIITDFESLVKSFEESNKSPNMESFSDLLHSFHNDEFSTNNGDINNDIKPIEQIETVIDCFSSVQTAEILTDTLIERNEHVPVGPNMLNINVENAFNCQNERNEDVPVAPNMLNINVENAFYENERNEHIPVAPNMLNINVENSSNENEKLDNTTTIIFKDSNRSEDSSGYSSHSHALEDPGTHALAAAGLPTYFGKQKKSKNKCTKKPSNNGCNYDNVNVNILQSECQSRLPKKVGNSHKKIQSNRGSKKAGNKVYNSHVNAHSYINDDMSECSHSSSNRNEVSNTLEQRYFNWYNQIKMVRQQIEYAVYIEEIKNLY